MIRKKINTSKKNKENPDYATYDQLFLAPFRKNSGLCHCI